MLNRDRVRLLHMLEAAQLSLSHISGFQKEHLFKNRLLLDGIVRELEILGEAASQVSQKSKDQIPQIPWRKIVGMRNRLIHAYFDVDIDTVWLVLVDYLPKLVIDLETLLQKWPESTD